MCRYGQKYGIQKFKIWEMLLHTIYVFLKSTTIKLLEKVTNLKKT